MCTVSILLSPRRSVEISGLEMISRPAKRISAASRIRPLSSCDGQNECNLIDSSFHLDLPNGTLQYRLTS